ncbi:MAG TPA: restriction endonuclease subunit S [Actinomycetota bacterium]|nr:restriction endonuclease subunit S [Actinomycetota bacterium]
MAEGLYKLPQGWRWVRLGEVASKPQYGYTASATTEPKGPKFLRITDITTGEVDWRKVPYCEADEKVLAKYALNAGDILFARSGSIGATMVIKDTPPESAVFASYLIRVRLSKEVLPEYMGLLLKAPLCQSQLVPRGAAQRNINAKHIQQLFIPLPPLSEQRRIVARIEELMARVREARRLRQQAREDAERLWQSVLAETFPRPGADLPEGWRWVKLGEVAAIRYGKANPKKPGLVPVIGSGGIYDHTEAPLVSHLTVIVGRKGSAGEVMLMEEPCWPSDTTFYLEWKCEVCPQWVYHWLRWFKPSPEGTSPTLPSLRREYLESLSIPLPPVSEQRRIVAHLEEVRGHVQALKKAQEETEARLKDLERSILDKAFQGEL